MEERRLRLKPHQDELIFSDAPYVGLGGGWGNGKTTAGCVAAYLRCEESPGNRFLIGRRQFTDLRDSTLNEFLTLFGDRVRYSKGDMTATLSNGSQILFRHVDNLQSLTNLNLGGYSLEQAEEISEDAVIFLDGRCRLKSAKRRQRFFTFNMNGHDHLWRRFKVKVDDQGQPVEVPTDYHLIEATTYANRDNLPADYIRMLERMPENVRKRYVMGSWDVFEGQIWPQYSEALHVIDPFRPPQGWEIFESCDHGYNNPTAWYWYAVDYDGNVFIFDEHYLAGATVAEHAKAVKAKRTFYGIAEPDIAYSVIDPSTKNREGITGLSVMAEYEDNGITTLTEANNDVLAGINRVAEFLTFDPERKHPITGEMGSPRLFITRNCVNARAEIPTYQWKAMNNRSSALNRPEAPRKYRDHACDSIRYGIMSRPDAPERRDNIRPGTVQALVHRHLEVIRAKQGQSGDPMKDWL